MVERRGVNATTPIGPGLRQRRHLRRPDSDERGVSENRRKLTPKEVRERSRFALESKISPGDKQPLGKLSLAGYRELSIGSWGEPEIWTRLGANVRILKLERP